MVAKSTSHHRETVVGTIVLLVFTRESNHIESWETFFCWYVQGNRIIPGVLRWCGISSIHSMDPCIHTRGSKTGGGYAFSRRKHEIPDVSHPAHFKIAIFRTTPFAGDPSEQTARKLGFWAYKLCNEPPVKRAATSTSLFQTRNSPANSPGLDHRDHVSYGAKRTKHVYRILTFSRKPIA